ncbi:hypothetical protein ABPG74_021990 [Tetrahymena malaccensis]
MTFCKNCGLQKNHIEQQCGSNTFSLFPQQQQNKSLNQEYLVNQSKQKSEIGQTINTLTNEQSNHNHTSPNQVNQSLNIDNKLQQLLNKYNNNQDSNQHLESSEEQKQKDILRDKYLPKD